MKTKSIIFSLTFFLFPYWLFGQAGSGADVTKVGTSSAAFLGIDIGARATAMGGSFVALADDISAIYWNPAGIARLRGGEIAFIHTEWLLDTSFDWAAITFPIAGFGTIGASITALIHDDIEITTIEQPEGTGEFFGANDLALGLTYAISLTDRFSIGFNGKFIQSKIFNESANGFGFDVGTLFVTQVGLRIGATLTNFGSKMELSGRDLIVLVDIAPDKEASNDRLVSNLETGSFDLPLAFRVGVAMDIIQKENVRWTIAVEGFNPSDNTESVNLGTEYVLGDFAAFRFGYKSLFNDDSEEGITLGGGINLNLIGGTTMILDYAYSDFGRLRYVQRFSVIIEF